MAWDEEGLIGGAGKDTSGQETLLKVGFQVITRNLKSSCQQSIGVA